MGVCVENGVLMGVWLELLDCPFGGKIQKKLI